MLLPQLIVDGSSGGSKVPMIKFLIPIYVKFACFEILDKNFSLHPIPSPGKQCTGYNSADFQSAIEAPSKIISISVGLSQPNAS